MLDAGWTLAAIAAHFGVDVKEVEQAIQRQVKSERTQGDDQGSRKMKIALRQEHNKPPNWDCAKPVV